jgi:eukaryotic-like serine/threonine-protein kinase
MEGPLDWGRLDPIFDMLLDLPVEQRRRTIGRLVLSDPSLQPTLELLDDVIEGRLSRFDRPAFAPIETQDSWSPRLETGQVIGPYTIVEQIGRGGMGEVYCARRSDGQFDQQVAIKVIRADAELHLARFDAERRILARLAHPDIMRIYDGGVLPGGEPYMVTELVSGQPITTWCRRNCLELGERLRLFLAVCEVVAYAHRSLVVHRDLKPENIFVTDDGHVKILDFGIAKDIRGTDEVEHSVTPLSLDFAAPEQITGAHPVSVMTDVYALGMLLFELLTDQRPWTLGDLPLTAAMQIIIDRQPSAPSQAAERSVSPPVPPGRLTGDLDAIVGVALQKDPDCRYRTVDALIQDIHCYQRNRPITARSSSRLYVAGRFLRRHRLLIGLAALVLVLLGGGLAGVTAGYIRAEHEARRATTIKTFLVSLFTDRDPDFPLDVPRDKVSADALMRLGVARIDREFSTDPSLKLELLNIAGEIYEGLSDPTGYAAVQEKILRQDAIIYGDHSRQFIRDDLQLAKTAIYSAEWENARKILDQTFKLIVESGQDDVLLAEWWNTQGEWLRSQPRSAAARAEAYQKAIHYIEGHEPHSNIMIGAVGNLATIRFRSYDFSAARALYEQAIQISLDLPDAGFNLVTAYMNLGTTLAATGNVAGALENYRKSEDLAEKIAGREHQAYWFARMRHAALLHKIGERLQADAIFQGLLGIIPSDWSKDSMRALVEGEFGARLSAEGQTDQAIPLLKKGMAVLEKRPFQEDDVRRLRIFLGDAYDQAGMIDDARQSLKLSLDEYLAKGDDGVATHEAQERWIRFRIEHHEVTDFDMEMLDKLSMHTYPWDSTSTSTALTWNDRAMLFLRDGNLRKAVESSDKSMALISAVSGLHDVRDVIRILLVRSAVLSASGRKDEAVVTARSALSKSIAANASESTMTGKAHETLAAVSSAQ